MASNHTQQKHFDMIDKFNFIIPEGFVLVLRTVKSDMSAYGGFVYPTSGKVWAEDWDETPECGKGLHGWLWGEGDDSLAIGEEGSRLWMVILVDGAKIVPLNGKVKFPEGEVVFCGDCETAVKTIQWFAPAGTKINRSTNIGGYRSTNSGGNGSTNSGGNESTNSGGDRSTNSGGDGSTNIGGNESTNSGGYRSTNSGGYRSTNIGGDESTNSGGDRSTNIGGNESTNSGGDGGSVVVGETFAKCKAGIGGLLVFRYYCDEADGYRLKFAEVDGVKIRENIFYTLSKSLEIVEAGDN